MKVEKVEELGSLAEFLSDGGSSRAHKACVWKLCGKKTRKSISFCSLENAHAPINLHSLKKAKHILKKKIAKSCILSMFGTIRYIYLYRRVPGAQKIPQGVAGRITWLLIISTKLACVEKWHKTKNFKFELLTDFSLLELQVLPRQGLPGIVDVQQLDELPGHRVGQLVDELGRPLASRVACFA